jgi:hypothetical protein
MDKSVRRPLKVAIIPTFRGIVVQVRIYGLKRAKRAFSAGNPLLEMAFLPFSAIFPSCKLNHYIARPKMSLKNIR